MPRNLRWKFALIGFVLLLCVYYVYPTVRWSFTSPGKKAALRETWKRETDEVEGRPFYIHLLYSLKRWFQGDEDRIVNLGLDLQGGMHAVLEVDTSKASTSADKSALVKLATDIIRRRVDELGLREPVVQREGVNRIIVEIPGIVEEARVRSVIGRTGYLEFRLVADESVRRRVLAAVDRVKDLSSLLDIRGGFHEGCQFSSMDVAKENIEKVRGILALPEVQEKIPEKYAFAFGFKKREGGRRDFTLVENRAVIDGGSLKRAYVEYGREGTPEVRLEFDRKGGRELTRISSRAARKFREDRMLSRLAIVLDGEVYSAPFMTKRVPSNPVITGRFTHEEAADLAIVLRTGALPAPIGWAYSKTVGPSLGRDSIAMGLKAALLGLALVLLFMGVYYRGAGLIADVALLLNMAIVLAFLGACGATLTLPGLAGLILTVGMSVDANVLIFERIREELSSGKRVRTAITNGYERAFTTILDASLTTFITAFILFLFGTGPIKGFAIVLMIGIVGSMFTALFCTRALFDWIEFHRPLKDLRMLRLVGRPKIDFLGFRGLALSVSLLIVCLSLALFWTSGERKYGIDFKGGDLLQIKFGKPVSVEAVRNALEPLDIGKPVIQHFGTADQILVRGPLGSGERVKEALKGAVDGNTFEEEDVRMESVGPVIAGNLRRQAFIAIGFALFFMVLYISWRFEFKFGVAAIVALGHDVIITLGFFLGLFLLPMREMSLPVIAVILTIVGYSINDTIVVFDRIREDLKIMRKASYREVLNASINQTLSRTLLTSLTTLVVVLCLFFLGGPVINDFAFALIVGIIVGTYSSVFIASPLLLLWHRRRA